MGIKGVYVISLCIALVAMNIFGYGAKKKQTPLALSLMRLIVCVTITVILSMCTNFTSNKEIALFLQTVHYASTEWLLIFFVHFLEIYVNRVRSNRFMRGSVYIIATINSISMLLNAVFHHVVTCDYVSYRGQTYYTFLTISPWYEMHAYFSYLLALCALLALVGATGRATAFYRRKYYPAVVAMILTFTIEGICSFKNAPVDYALFGYILLAMFLTYHSVYYQHKSLITETLSYIVRDAHSGVVCFDIYDKCIYANDEARQLYPNVSELSDYYGIFSEILNNQKFSEVSKRKWDTELNIDGNKSYYDVTFGRLSDKKGNYIGCYFYLYDKTQDIEKYVKERYRATHDSLTTLYNREYFFERVKRMRNNNPYTDYYIVAMDIKDFKLVNDLFGFKKGDYILTEFAHAMKEVLPEGSACARTNSDHFAFCIRKDMFSEEDIIAGIKKVKKLIESTEYQMHIHAGVYMIQPGDEDVSVMYDYARMALRLIKDDYHRIFSYYDESLMKKILREKQLVGEFEQALQEKQFLMYLQPQVTPDGTVVGAEALVRWKHPEQGMISPGEFIGVFENAGLIYRLDMYIWEQAAAKLKEWKLSGKGSYHISVNISTRDFYYLDLYKTFTELVEKYDIEPDKLKLEITESAFMNDQDKQLSLLARLREYGFHVEIDDFGSGYSSLNMLKDMQVDVLKIDMGFLRETEKQERTKVILNTVVELAKNLQMVVICEGVEHKEQVDYLTESGCDMFQGFYFDRPIEVAEFEKRYFSE